MMNLQLSCPTALGASPAVPFQNPSRILSQRFPERSFRLVIQRLPTRKRESWFHFSY